MDGQRHAHGGPHKENTREAAGDEGEGLPLPRAVRWLFRVQAKYGEGPGFSPWAACVRVMRTLARSVGYVFFPTAINIVLRCLSRNSGGYRLFRQGIPALNTASRRARSASNDWALGT